MVSCGRCFRPALERYRLGCLWRLVPGLEAPAWKTGPNRGQTSNSDGSRPLPRPGPWGYAPDPVHKTENRPQNLCGFLSLYFFISVKKMLIIFPVMLIRMAFLMPRQRANASTPNTDNFT